MKHLFSTLLKIILRIHSPSLGRVPRLRDLNARKVNEEIAIPLHQGLQEAIDNKSVSGKADAAGPFDFETVARNFQELAEVMSGKKESDELFITSGFKSKALICKNCGGQIDRKSGKCPFCDTEYDFEEESESYVYLYADDRLVEKIKLGGDTQ
ncbi:hypothetical protein [Ruminococcus sp.]|uniref:hypothetical protein n=1 Tax=Ruminococcus sp. TaxID=41978 RepID=UPI003868A81C